MIHPLTFSGHIVLPGSDSSGFILGSTCGLPCGEPMMALAPDDTIYVSAPRGVFAGNAVDRWRWFTRSHPGINMSERRLTLRRSDM